MTHNRIRNRTNDRGTRYHIAMMRDGRLMIATTLGWKLLPFGPNALKHINSMVPININVTVYPTNDTVDYYTLSAGEIAYMSRESGKGS